MAIVKFQQDTEKPFGTGNFVDDKGKSTYLTDPDTASKFVDTLPGQGGAGKPSLSQQMGAETDAIATKTLGSAQPAKGPDLRLASNMTDAFDGVGGSAATDAAAAPGALTATPPAPLSGVHAVGNVAPPGTPMAKVTAFIGMGGGKPPAGAPPAAPAPAVAPPAVPPPATPPGAGVLELAGQTDTDSGSTVKGRDKRLAAGDVAAMEKTGGETDTAILDQGKAQDERALGALDVEKQGLQSIEERNRNQVIDEQLKKQAIADAKGKLDDELKANDEKLDPDQYMKRMSTGKKLGMVILAALNGGFGSLIGQKSNGVLDGVDAAIDHNIDKQKQEIAAGRTRIGNDIAEFMRKGHDAETAEQLARDRANSAVDQMFGLDAKRMGIQGQQLEQAQMLVKQRGEQRAVQRAQIMKETEDRTTSQWQKTRTMQQKQTGKPMTEKEFYETKKAELDYKNAALDTMSAADVGQAIGKPVSPQEAQRIKDRVKEVGAGINETSGAVDMTKNLIESMGAKFDTTTGKIEWPKSGDLAGVGWWDSSNVIGGQLEKRGLTYTNATKVKDNQNALLEFITSNLTGATATPEQRATFTNMAGADLGNEERAKEQLQNWANTLFSLRNDQMARLGPDGQRFFAASQQQAKQGAGAPPLQERRLPPAPAAPAAPAVPPPVERQPTFTPNNPLQIARR